jgi:serine/threonine protein phosphatase PrpC
MNCPACGANNRDDAHFCRSCGSHLAEAPEPAVEPEAASDALETPPPEPEPELATEGAPDQEPEAETGVEPAAEAPAGELPLESPAVEPPVEEPAEAEVEAKVEAEESEPDAAVEPSEPPAEEVEPAQDLEPLPEPEDDVLGFWREEVEPLKPAEPGTVIAGRYVLVEALEVEDDEIIYLARDLKKCWQCGFEDNAPDEAFCARCGATLEHKPGVHLAEVLTANAEPSGGEAVAARLKESGRYFLLLAESGPEEKAPAPPAATSIRLLVGQRSDPGQVRELDEDSLLVLTLAPTYESRMTPVSGLFAVADGMGGHEGGEVASKLALQVLAERVLRTIILSELAGELILDDEVVVRLRQAFMAANDAVYLARQKAGNDMGTTLTVVYVRDERLVLAHVGDCRAYRWNADGLEQLTTDHSVVASMIASGQAAPEEIYTHPHRSVIYRCIGDKPTVEVDTDLLPLVPGERLVLCCDGLWEMIRSEGIADAMMQEADPQVACDLMVKRANAAGGDDNISVIVVQVETT